MDESDQQNFDKALDELLAFFEALSINRNIWWKTLNKYPLEQIIAGFEAHIQDPEHGMHPPKPAHIIKHIERLFSTRGGCYKPYVPPPMPRPAATPMIAPAFEALKLPNARYTPLYWKMYAEGFNKYGLRGPELVRWALAHSIEEAKIISITKIEEELL
jgi:hypothetical protein